MSERDTFLRAIGEAWDDPTPVLVFADWAEEHGTDDPALLRWYGWHVMPALARVRSNPPHASNGVRDRAGKAVGRHPQKDVLLRCAAVALCRRPAVWDGDGKEEVRSAVAQCRSLALGLGSETARAREFRRANAAAEALVAEIEAAHAAGQFDLVHQVANRMRVHLLAADLLAEKPHLARTAVAHRALIPVPLTQHAAERGWQAAVYAALAAVPPLL